MGFNYTILPKNLSLQSGDRKSSNPDNSGKLSCFGNWPFIPHLCSRFI